MPKATFLKSAWYIQSNLHVRPPLVSDHLSKTPKFSHSKPCYVITTPRMRPRPLLG